MKSAVTVHARDLGKPLWMNQQVDTEDPFGGEIYSLSDELGVGHEG